MENDDLEFQELLLIEQQIKMNEAINTFQQKSNDEEFEFSPIYDEYYNNNIVEKMEQEFDEKTSPCWDGYTQLGMKKNKKGRLVPNCVPIEKKSDLKDPDGGLTAAGRKYFKNKEGANLKPGVKGPADTPEKMRRKGSFLTRFFTNPSGPMVDEKGRATRLALSATAWGERVPKNTEDAARLAEKGRNLLERYKKTNKKDDLESVEEKQLPGQTIGQQAGGSIGGGNDPTEGIDKDSDGMIFDGTPEERRAPYKRQSNDSYEKSRRKFVRAELARQGIKRNARVQDRSKQERDARARARAAYDKSTVAAGEEEQNRIDRGRRTSPATTNPKPADRYPNPSSDRSRKPADRYPDPPNADRGRKPADRYPNPPNADRGRKPADRYPDPPNADRGRKPADRYPDPPNADRGRKPADRYPNPSAMDNKPADRYPNPSSDRSRTPADRYPDPSRKYPPGQKPERPFKPAGTGRNFSERRPTTLEERDKNRGPSQKPSTLERRDKNKGPSGPIVPRSI